MLMLSLSKSDYDFLLQACSIGMIFLGKRFTISNFPSRLTSYLEAGLPVITCTDKASDMGAVVEHAGCGYKLLSEDLQGFKDIIEKIKQKPSQLSVMLAKARTLFEDFYTASVSYSIIMAHFSE